MNVTEVMVFWPSEETNKNLLQSSSSLLNFSSANSGTEENKTSFPADYYSYIHSSVNGTKLNQISHRYSEGSQKTKNAKNNRPK